MNTAPIEKKETKTVLLLLPQQMEKTFIPFQLLHIRREKGRVDYREGTLNRREVLQEFPALADEAKMLLLRFAPEPVANLVKETEQRYKKQKAGIPQKTFVAQALLRQLHQQFSALKPFYAQLRCYHRLRKQGTTAIQTLSCTFSTEKPSLRFGVEKDGNLLRVKTFIALDGQSSELAEFTRSAFFLQKENTYYLLSFTDYQTLEWLHGIPGEGLEQEPFTDKILSRLEEAYLVDRNGLLDDQTVDQRPQCRVLLSELNGAFLLLTPQWLYDGLLVEGPYKPVQEVSAGGNRYIVRRHQETEAQFLALLTSFHPAFADQRNGYKYLSFAEAQKKQWFIKTYYRLLELDVDIVGMDMLHHFRYSSHKAETTVTLRAESDGLQHLQVAVRFGREAVSLHLLQKALHAGQRAIVLKDGSLGILHDEWLAEYGLLFKHGKVHEGELQVSKFLLFAGENRLAQPAVTDEWRARWQQWQNNPAPLFAVPACITATLRPYQQKGFEWLALLSQAGAGACLADDMGLGKTLQTITFLAWYSQQHPGTRHLIVCPTSLLYNWQTELKKFAPTLQAEVYHGTSKCTAACDVLITSYGTLRANSETLLTQRFGITVIDESHNIKNPSAQITRAVQQLQASIRLALSGTPVVNNTFDLFAQMDFALPGLLGSRAFFKREYADAIDRDGNEEKIKALQRLTAPFILRRTKEQVAADLPSKTETVLWCNLAPAQESLYNEIREQVRSNLFLDIQNKGLQKTKLAVLQGLLKLRQICNHPLLLPSEEHGGRSDSAKTDLLFDELANLGDSHKVLLFSQFSSMLQLLAAACDRRGLRYFLLDGQTPAHKRAAMVQDFQENAAAPPLFLISLKAGNTGLNLTAADYVFLFDPWWNTAVEQQAIDRVHRIGQTKNVFAYKLVCRNTIEEKILELQQRKKQLAEELITAEEDFVKSLDEAEIAYLFG